ncbi:hypothetical protein ACFQ3L_09010 [Lacticaseibacillus jixianensis]|uniref:Uncharacterized protein n=1 Tax=Lacticaseibacillus jixianensis TaxID=2486012 RepID=A0ABW4BBY1_9LACO|nr:hypothetical protein [Lacticaseibacillus jixianensis]
MASDYTKMMDDLRAGKIAEIKIEPATFAAFRTAWTNYPSRKEIVGQAKRGGTILYHYQSAKAQ